MAATSVPWRTEPLVYGSDLHHRLPPGLTMPVALHVDFLDDSSAAIWLPSLDVVDHQWDTADFVRAAHLLGRLAGSPAVAELAELGDADGGPRTARTYANGRLAVQVAPALRSEELWRAPWLADAFDADLRAALLAETEAACLPAYVEGLHAEGVAADTDTVARAHALHLLLFSGLSAPLMDPAVPGADADALAAEARERAAISRFCLGLVATT
jgi:hypothetical protein